MHFSCILHDNCKKLDLSFWITGAILYSYFSHVESNNRQSQEQYEKVSLTLIPLNEKEDRNDWRVNQGELTCERGG